jgi:N-acetylmuramidase
MFTTFVGRGHALSQGGLTSICDELSVKAAEVWAVLAVETCGCGYLAERCPPILFERHIFNRLTNGIFDREHPELSNSVPGGYIGGIGEYDRLRAAEELRHNGLAPAAIEEAALKATLWGLAQIMGMNFSQVGFASVQAMVTAMLDSEDAQLNAFARFLQSNKLDGALRSHDWASLARGYNGPDYGKNSYDQRLAGNYARYNVGPLPDLTIRAAQLYLGYLHYKPGVIDGIAGRLTIAALHQFKMTTSYPAPIQ